MKIVHAGKNLKVSNLPHKVTPYQLTAKHAQQVSPREVVQRLAAHAEKSDPSLLDKASAFYSKHLALIKTLVGAALTIAVANMAEKQTA